MRTGFPKARPGMRVGLLGGSFDPAHEGHAHITRQALRRFGLDRVWWLVSPGNPLKAHGPAPMAQRLAAAEAVMHHPRVVITDIESRIGTRHTAATLARLMALYPGVRFVWLMGADNLTGFHRWENWEWILDNVPVGILARPGQGVAAQRSRAAIAYARYRLRAAQARCLPMRHPPAWCFVNMPMVDLSSSDIRARGGW
ncbi:nicotinate-nucleotide adenylyltransferase [Rhodovulum bhavnagarense]|nr:nicotinate-nucleotide adenylyltransferase [Rhodovulum bhavnagarense]